MSRYPVLALAVALLGLPAVVGCSGSDAAGAGGNDTTPKGRDTSIVHEPCDGNASGARKLDVNNDRRPDITHVLSGKREVCRILDLNFDGTVDAYVYFDEHGQTRRRESDFDRDGRIDEIATYKGGRVVRKERETNFDNKIDTWDFYEGDRLVKRERDSDGDGRVDQWWTFNVPNDPRCAVVASDRDGDGRPEPDSVLDLCGESYGAPPPDPPPADAGPAASGDGGGAGGGADAAGEAR